MGDPAGIKRQYRQFAGTECKGYSDLYYRLAISVSEDDEMAGLDLSQHSETAYALGGSSYGEYGMSAPGTGAFAEAMKAAQAKRPAH